MPGLGYPIDPGRNRNQAFMLSLMAAAMNIGRTRTPGSSGSVRPMVSFCPTTPLFWESVNPTYSGIRAVSMSPDNRWHNIVTKRIYDPSYDLPIQWTPSALDNVTASVMSILGSDPLRASFTPYDYSFGTLISGSDISQWAVIQLPSFAAHYYIDTEQQPWNVLPLKSPITFDGADLLRGSGGTYVTGAVASVHCLTIAQLGQFPAADYYTCQPIQLSTDGGGTWTTLTNSATLEFASGNYEPPVLPAFYLFRTGQNWASRPQIMPIRIHLSAEGSFTSSAKITQTEVLSVDGSIIRGSLT